MNNTFFELLQAAAGARESVSTIPANREEWEELFKTVGEHSLLAVTFPVIDRLHDETDIPLSVYSRWAMVAEKTEEKNRSHREACVRLHDRFLENGMRTCILKGQAAAALYPEPGLRQSGDIDIWVEGERQATVDFLRERFPVKKVVYHHCDVQMLKGIGVEVHFTPTWMNSPFANRRLQKWFKACSEAQFSRFDEALGFCVPTLRFDAVYMLLHIYRHVLDEGVGLRQLLDYYYVLKHLDDTSRAEAFSDLKLLRMQKFAAQVMYVLREVFNLDGNLMLCAPDGRGGEFLLSEILRAGNFGRYDPRNAHEKGEGMVKHGRRKFGRGVRFFFHYPSEVFWMPFFMLWQYLWRRRHHYLYKGR